LVDGPQTITGLHRQVITLKRLSLTDVLVTKLPRNATQKNIKKAWDEQNTLSTWQSSAWAKKMENKVKRASLSDFDRFKVMIAKKQKSKIVAAKIAELA
jgi:large subunit ribosomal protein L14e